MVALSILKRHGRRYLVIDRVKYPITSKRRSDRILERLDKILKALTKRLAKAKRPVRLRLDGTRVSHAPTITGKGVTHAAFISAIQSVFPALMNQKPTSYVPAPKDTVIDNIDLKLLILENDKVHANDLKTGNKELNEQRKEISHLREMITETRPEAPVLLPARGYSSNGRKVGRPRKAKAIPDRVTTPPPVVELSGDRASLFPAMGNGVKKPSPERDSVAKHEPVIPGIPTGGDVRRSMIEYIKQGRNVDKINEYVRKRFIIADETDDRLNVIYSRALKEIREEAAKYASPKKQEGTGIDDTYGLSNIDIKKLMAKAPNFLGVFAVNQLSKIKPGLRPDFSFIMNTKAFPKDGHWVAVRADRNTLEYADAFGDQPSAEFTNAMQRIMHRYTSNLVQFKISSVKRQRITSLRCGYHSMLFLSKRQAGLTFAEATGFKRLDLSSKTEKEAKRLEKKVLQFGHL